jgi:hypothetical protein
MAKNLKAKSNADHFVAFLIENDKDLPYTNLKIEA